MKFIVKFIGIAVLLIALLVTCASVGSDSGESKPHIGRISLETQKSISQKLIATEPRVKDAAWSTSTTLLVGVLNDGSRRDGYASYICQVLYEDGLKGIGVWVKVIDIEKLVRDNTRAVLGEARCN